MSSLINRKQAFIKLGEYLGLLSDSLTTKEQLSDLIERFSTEQDKFWPIHKQIREYIDYSTNSNPWFTRDFLLSSIHSIGESLTSGKINHWLEKYENDISSITTSKTIGVVMAGNLPLVGFHDYLSVLMSGHRLHAKLAHNDKTLLPLLHQVLGFIEPELLEKAIFTEGTLTDFDAIIATGSNNTARYFEYYFGKFPSIIRKNRNGIAVLNGDETTTDLESLADDVFKYFGLGCRNVSKLFIPRGYDFKDMFTAFEKYSLHINHHSKYANNYDYNKSIFLINKIKFLDNGIVMLKEDTSFSSPISVIYYEYYDSLEGLEVLLELQKDKIQCLLSRETFKNLKHLPFGMAQQPELWDYADGIDTLEFLLDQ